MKLPCPTDSRPAQIAKAILSARSAKSKSGKKK